ncbi:LysR family transcriptional regulator, partial [Curvivirga aplysinae]|uniref:LysR family transcriptional regulator n=1 Tax=Curvivirga aplysinae TaxID=2529852 RepID=UPI0012BB59AD
LSTLPLTFVTVVEAGSITGAADELSIAKSAVSQNLKRLEEQLNVKLAVRTTRRFSLTPAGERYYHKCKEMLALSQMAKTEMEAFGAKPSGALTITAPHAFITPIIVPAISRLLKLYPDLTPNVIADDKRLNLVAEGIDLSITVGTLPDSDLRARRIGELYDVLYIAPSLLAHAADKRTPEFIDWLNSLPYIAHSRETQIVEHLVKLGGDQEEVSLEFKPRLRGNTIEAVTAFAKQGLGIALLPNIGVLDDVRVGDLVPLLETSNSDPTPIYALHAYDNLLPKSIDETIEAIQKVLESNS